jgi:hypothetical protein
MFENHSTFKIHSDAERFSWAAFYFFVILSSLVGDTLILYASFQREVFKLNKLIVTVIQYIAVSDLVYAITTILPAASSLISNSSVSGNAMCYTTVYLGYLSYMTGNCFIAILTSCKFLLLKFPHQAAFWSRRLVHRVCSLAFIPPLILIISMLTVDKDDVAFDYKVYNCRYGFHEDIWKNILPVMSILTFFLPNSVIVGTTIPTLKYLLAATKSARRVNRSMPWQGTLTVVLTAVVFCISTLPMFVFYFGQSFVNQDPTGPFFLHYFRFAGSISMINIMSNFYIYTLTIKSFRSFLLSKIRFLFSIPSVFLRAIRNILSTGNFVYVKKLVAQIQKFYVSISDHCHT